MKPLDNVSRRHGAWVIAVLVVALALRLFIVLRGGEYYWADEQRYEAARKATTALFEGKPDAVARALFSTSGHIGFRWMAMLPAIAERAVLRGKVYDARFCSGFFALFGVVNLFLVWRISRRLSTGEGEPLLALVFAACSNALFFHARHCFPYDASLTFFLVAVYVSVGPVRRWQALLVGLCCGWGYLTYNGYWSIALVVLALDVLWRREPWLERVQRSVVAFVGFIAPIGLMFGAAGLAGYNLITDSLEFSKTVNQGDFGVGWRFPADYLRVTDGMLWLILGAIIVIGVVRCVARRETPPWLRWIVVVAALYAIWVLFCDVVPKFVLYGRTVRGAVPFLALAAAGACVAIRRDVGRGPRALLAVAWGVACISGVSMMLTPLRQTFPRDFQNVAQRLMAEVRQREPDAVLRTMYAEYLSSPNFPEEPPPHRELLRRPHPHQYLPYLYEGYTREQRPLYHGRDIAMRVIALDTSRGLHAFKRSETSRWLAPHPGPLSFFVRLPRNKMGETETLLLSGGAADPAERVVIHYVDATHVRLGFRRGGAAAQMSEPLVCDYDDDHAIGVSLGSLFPRESDDRFASRPELKPLVRKFVITLDGQTGLTGTGDFSPVVVSDIAVGDAAGRVGPAASPGFSGQLHSVRQVDPRLFGDERMLQRPVAMTGPFFGECHGTLELRVRFPKELVPGAEPLLASGRPGAGDLLFVSYQGKRQVRFHVDHWGTPSIQSELVEIEPGAEHRLIVSLGSLFPPRDDPRYGPTPHLRRLEHWLYVSVNDRVVFSRPFDFYATDPDAVSFGVNIPGGTACAPKFSGEILEVRRRPPEKVFPSGVPMPEHQ